MPRALYGLLTWQEKNDVVLIVHGDVARAKVQVMTWQVIRHTDWAVMWQMTGKPRGPTMGRHVDQIMVDIT